MKELENMKESVPTAQHMVSATNAIPQPNRTPPLPALRRYWRFSAVTFSIFQCVMFARYKESFGLSDSFACQHKRVGSVFMMLNEHPSILVMREVSLQQQNNVTEDSFRGALSIRPTLSERCTTSQHESTHPGSSEASFFVNLPMARA